MKYRANKEHIDKFRNSRLWKDKIRPYILARDGYLCQECKRKGKINHGKEVHHKKPLHAHWELRADEDNLEALCRECHNRIDYELEHGKPKTSIQTFLEEWNANES